MPAKYSENIIAFFYRAALWITRCSHAPYTTGTDTFVIPRWYVPRYTTLGTFAYMAQ